MSHPTDTRPAAGATGGAAIHEHVKLGLPALIAISVGSMVGGGIYNISHQTAGVANTGPMLLGWLVTGLGVLALVMIFSRVTNDREDLNAGVYSYARANFGDFVGFQSAWGYWIASWLGNVGFYLVVCNTLGTYFISDFGDGTNLLSLIGMSVLLWIVHYLVSLGIKEAAMMNLVVTIAKVVPVIVFIIFGIGAFKMGLFTADFWAPFQHAAETDEAGAVVAEAFSTSTLQQVKDMMFITLWVFIGIEGAAVYSARAKARSDVGKASVTALGLVLALLVLVNVVTYAAMARAEAAGLERPSMAGVMEEMVGHWGAIFVAIGLLISVLGGVLSWSMVCAEVLAVPAEDGVMPRTLAKHNRHDVPITALWWTNVSIQAFLIFNYFAWGGTYDALVYLTSAMVLFPYLFVAIFGLIHSLRGHRGASRMSLLPWGVLGVAYALFCIYAGGLEYAGATAIFYTIGVPIYWWRCQEQKGSGDHNAWFKWWDYAIIVGLVALSIWAVIGMQNGTIAL